jgi:protein O-mannosyl-transferase
MRASTPWTDILKHDFWGQSIALPLSHKSYRPLTTASLRLNRVLAAAWNGTTDNVGGLAGLGSAFGYHLANVLLHALVCALVLVLFRSIFDGQEAPAVLAAVIYTVHPVHVEPVAALVGRADLLSGLFTVLALLCTLKTKSTRTPKKLLNHTAALVCSVAAAASKETGITVLGVMCAFECIDLLQRYWCTQKHSKTVTAKAVTACKQCWQIEGVVPAVRIATSVVLAVAIVCGHVMLHQGAPLRPWSILENDIAVMQRWVLC